MQNWCQVQNTEFLADTACGDNVIAKLNKPPALSAGQVIAARLLDVIKIVCGRIVQAELRVVTGK